MSVAMKQVRTTQVYASEHDEQVERATTAQSERMKRRSGSTVAGMMRA
jgi:hypothetical protein